MAKRAVYLIGANFHALAIYDTAADYYEQFATKYPGRGRQEVHGGREDRGHLRDRPRSAAERGLLPARSR